MKFTAPGDLEGFGRIRIFDPEGYVCIEFPIETVADMAAGHIFSVLAGKRRIIDIKGHCDGGLGDLLERDRLRMIGRAESVADMEVVDPGDGDDRSNPGLLHLYAAQAFKFIELADLDLAVHIRIVVVDDDTFLIDTQPSVIDLADTDPADVLIVVDRADQHLSPRLGITLGRGDIIDDGLKKRFHAGARTAQIQGRDT